MGLDYTGGISGDLEKSWGVGLEGAGIWRPFLETGYYLADRGVLGDD